MGSHPEVALRRAVPGGQTLVTPRAGRLRGGLVETLLVVTVLGVVGALVAAGVVGMNERVSRIACDADVSGVALAADTYYARHLVYPADTQALYDEGYLPDPSDGGHLVLYRRTPAGNGYRVVGETSSGRPCRTVSRG